LDEHENHAKGEMQVASILIDRGTVITMDTQRRIIDNGAVVIEQDRIQAIGHRRDIVGTRKFDETIDASDMVVLPGLIDCHAHAGHGLLKSLGTDLGDSWNEACEKIYSQASSAEFWEAEAELATLERLKFGITCGVSLLGGGNSIYRSDDPIYAARHCAAVERVGIRSFLAVGPCPPPYPRTFTQWHDGRATNHTVSLEDQLETCESVIHANHATVGGRIHVCLVSPTVHPDEVSSAVNAQHAHALNQQALETRALSRRHGLLFTQDGHRRGSVQYAHDHLDLLGPDALLSHSIDLSDEEVAIAAATDTRIVHHPSAIAAIMGRCPVTELLDAGVTVVIGSDATAPDRSSDLFRHMQQCMHYHRRHFRDPSVLPPGKTLEMVTIDAARALGQSHVIGSLEAGKKADLILLDLFKPHTYPLQMPLYRAVYFANGNDVDTVIVDGKILMRGREAVTVDERAVLKRAAQESQLALERSGLEGLTRMPERVWGHSRF
jgi:5-methylthioadenosine/S-adenosylhomocysteine deaminase